MKLSKALKEFLSLRSGRLTRSTQGHYRVAVTRLVRVIGDMKITKVQPKHLALFVADLYDQKERWKNCAYRPSASGGLSQHTIARQISTIKAFFNWWVKAQYLIKSPAVLLEYSLPADSKFKHITEEQVQLLLVAARHPRDYALIRFAVSTGARRGGLQGMKVSDLYLEERGAVLTEKGNKTRKVYFDQGTVEALERWLRIRPRDTEWLWVKDDGQPLTLNGVRQVLVRLCQKAGLRAVSLHMLRHTFAYTAIKRGIHIEHVQKNLGHAEIETTMIYAKQLDADHREAFKEPLFEVDRRPAKHLLKRVK